MPSNAKIILFVFQLLAILAYYGAVARVLYPFEKMEGDSKETTAMDLISQIVSD